MTGKIYSGKATTMRLYIMGKMKCMDLKDKVSLTPCVNLGYKGLNCQFFIQMSLKLSSYRTRLDNLKLSLFKPLLGY